MAFLQDNVAVIVGAVVFVVFTVGLVLALRTEAGREALAGGAVQVALAALALAEAWLAGVLRAEQQGGKLHRVIAAREILEG